MNVNLSNSSYCFNFTSAELVETTVVIAVLHVLAILACIVAMIFIFATKQHSYFVNRLVLYLVIASTFWSLGVIGEVIPVIHDSHNSRVKVRDGWEGACAALGFITQVTESVKTLVVCWIVLYLFILVVFKYNASRLHHEAFGLIIVVIVPLMVDWLPFVWNSYGLSGLWCWIKLTDDHCNDKFDGVGLILAIEYVPLLLASLFTLVCFLILLIVLCKRAHGAEMKWKWTSVYNKGLAETSVLMLYPCIYIIIFIFRFIHRTVYFFEIMKKSPPSYTLWLTSSTALGIGAIFVPLIYILRPSNLRKFYFCRRFVFKKKESSFGVVYRSNSVISTEALTESEGGEFGDSARIISNPRDSSLLYRSILS